MFFIKKILFLFTLLFIIIVNIDGFVQQINCDIKDISEYTLMECEKDCDNEEQKIDKFLTNSINYLISLNILINNDDNDKKYSFKLYDIPFEPPIA